MYAKIQGDDQEQVLQRSMRLTKRSNNFLDSKSFVDYIVKIIDKFDSKQQAKVFTVMYYTYTQSINNMSILTEQTDLFLALLPKIKTEMQSQALDQYFLVYIQKNSDREQTISQIDQKYSDSLMKIEEKYLNDQMIALLEFEKEKVTKSEFRLKGLIGFGSGIAIVALIAIILVFLSIQRIVNRIEEKLTKDVLTNDQGNDET
jgi:hypothetical protein